METVSDGCPTGILIDIDLQTKILNNVKENKKKQVSIKNKEKNIIPDTKSSHSGTSICFLDQSPPRSPLILKRNAFFTPKSSWKTPSPQSMKIISQEASRIVHKLYSSPINCSEVMIHDEVFPAVKSLDDACFDEVDIKSRNLPATDITFAAEEVDQSNPNSFDLTKCTISAVSGCTSETVVVSNELLSSLVLQSDMKPTIEHESISEKLIEAVIPENASTQETCVESDMSHKEKVKSDTCIANSSPAISESINVSSNPPLAPEHDATTHKKLPVVAKGFGFKKSVQHNAEKNKENELQCNGTKQTKYKPRFSKTEKSCSSIESGSKETKIRKNQILSNKSTVQLSSKQNITTIYSALEKKKAKESQNLEDNLSKNMIGNPKALLQKSNVVRSQSLFCKKDPLFKTGTLLETPIVESSVRRYNSFNAGSAKSAIPAVGKKFIPATDSRSRVLKPKTSLNQVSNIENGFSTPLQFGKYPQSLKLADANPVRRKSLAFNSNCSLVASGIKVAAQKNQHSISKKPAVTFSSRLGFGKKLNMPSSDPKFKKDSLPRKLFP